MSSWRPYALLLTWVAATWSWAGSEAPADNASAATDYAARRGSIVFQYYCAICHGVDADGQGRAAKLYEPKPANLKLSRVNDAYRLLIIRRGGAHVGRSEFMPAWQPTLTDAETDDVVAYLRSVLVQ